MGASLFRPPSMTCELAVQNLREALQRPRRNKSKAKAVVRMLKLAVKPKHAELLYRAGALDICIDLLEDEPRGSPMRELSLVAILCLTLDPFVRQDFVESNRKDGLEVIFRTVRQERPGSSVKYASIAVLHSLSRNDLNLPRFFEVDDNVETIMDTIAYEADGSPLRKLACEVILALASLPERRVTLHRSFLEIAPRLLIGEVGKPGPVLEIGFEILATLALDERTHASILDERMIIECALAALNVRRANSEENPSEVRHSRLAAIRMFHHLATGSEIIVVRLASMSSHRLIQACVDLLYDDNRGNANPADECKVIASQILHLFSSYPESRLELFAARDVAESLYLQSAVSLHARMAFVNLTGAFDKDDEIDPERKALMGRDDIDDRLIAAVRRACVRRKATEDAGDLGLTIVHGEEESNFDDGDLEGIGQEYDVEWELCSSAMLTFSVLLRRQHHLRRLGPELLPLVIRALERSVDRNDVRAVSFALACLYSLSGIVDTASIDQLFESLGRVQQKVHPSWKRLRVDAERLISGLSSSSNGNASRLQPVVNMLESVVDDKQRGFTRSLDATLSSLSHVLMAASKEEKVATGRPLMRLIPKALSKALHDKDDVSAKYAYELYEMVLNNTDGDADWSTERQKLTLALHELRQGSSQ